MANRQQQQPAASSQLVTVVEIARCKKLFQDPDAPLTISPAVKLYSGDTCVSTNTIQENADPFFNEAFEFAQPAELTDSGECPIKSMSFAYELTDAVFDPPRVVACGTFTIDTTANTKGENSYELYPPKESGARGECDATQEARGTLIVRFKVTIPKPKFVDVNKDVELAKNVVFTPAYRIVPEDRRRMWYHFLDTPAFREAFERKLVESFKEEKHERKHPTKTASDVINLRWKVKRSHQFMAKIRLCAEKWLANESVSPIVAEEETAAKLKWKELAALRSKLAPQRSSKVTELIDRLWLFYAADVDYRLPMTHISFEHRTKMQSTAFGKQQYEALVSCILQLFIPSLSANVADAIAKEDFENDPNANESAAAAEAEHQAALDATDHEGKDEVQLIAQRQVAELIGPAATTAGQPAVSTSAFKLFSATLGKFANYWCETLTDAEFMAVLKLLANAIPPARKKLGTAVDEVHKTPRSGRRRSSARRRSSPRTPRN